MSLIPKEKEKNEKNTHSQRIYDKKKKETRNLEEDLRIICSDRELIKLEFSKESLREKLEKFKKMYPGKYPIWPPNSRNVTESFKKWLKGEKIYGHENERISFYISPQKKKYWTDFIEESERFKTFSELIRISVDYYIKHLLNSSFIGFNMDAKNLSNFSFMLKESLTAIKGFSELLLNEYKEDLSNQVANIIENIKEQCQILESKISNSPGKRKFDVLLIEDNPKVTRLLKEIFKIRGCSYKIAATGQGGLDELKKSTPKLVLLDIMLPDIEGYEICKQIKRNNNLKHIPVYYETVIPEEIVLSKIEETGANGVISKPFDLSEITELLDAIV